MHTCRKDTLLTHRAFCDALAEESARLIAAANNSCSSTITTTCNNSSGGGGSSSHHSNNLLVTSNNSPLFLPFSSPPHAQNPNPLMFLSQEPHHHRYQLLPPFQPLTYLDDLPMTSSDSAVSADTVSFGLTPEGSVTMHAGGCRLTRDFLGVDDAGEVEELQMPVPLCAVAYQGRSSGPTTACCATDLTRHYLGWLPLVNEPWSNNF